MTGLIGAMPCNTSYYILAITLRVRNNFWVTAFRKENTMQRLSFFLQRFIYTLVIITLFSCSQKNKTEELIKQLEESLQSSNKVINLSTQDILKQLFTKTTYSNSMERAKFWYPKAEQISKLSKEMYNYLDSAKMELIEKKISTDFLNKSLDNYRKNLLDVDSSIRVEFTNNFNFLNPVSKTVLPSELIFLQNNIKVIENRIITFCNMKCEYIYHGFDIYSAIVGQNSKLLKPGDELEIQAGIGAFSRASLPKININGKNIPLSDGGYSIFKMKASTVSGEYKIPVTISYFNQTTGMEQTMNVNIEYSVAKECN
jgi:GldM N-terminal domain